MVSSSRGASQKISENFHASVSPECGAPKHPEGRRLAPKDELAAAAAAADDDDDDEEDAAVGVTSNRARFEGGLASSSASTRSFTARCMPFLIPTVTL